MFEPACAAVSQYANENEILFPPLSTIEVRDQWAKADVLVLEMRLSVRAAPSAALAQRNAPHRTMLGRTNTASLRTLTLC